MASHNENSKGAPTGLLILVGVILLAIGAIALNHTVVPLPGGINWNLGETVSTIGVLLITFPLIKLFYTQPLENAIQERNTNLERTFTEAEELRAEMGRMRTDYERRLQETEAAAREQIQAQIKEAQQLRQTLMAEASSRADDMVRRAQEEIESQKQRLMAELRIEVVNLTLGATERLLGENMDTEKNRRLVEEFIQKVEVPS